LFYILFTSHIYLFLITSLETSFSPGVKADVFACASCCWFIWWAVRGDVLAVGGARCRFLKWGRRRKDSASFPTAN